MFRPDKDLKLGSRRKGQARGSGSSRGGEGRDEVLEKARRERAQREKARASRGQAVSIQRQVFSGSAATSSWFRGRSAAVAARESQRADWDRKMSDFGKLQRTLVAQGIPFTPPVKFVMMALQQLLFFHRGGQDSARLCLFCESVLTVCILQADPSLNPAAHLAGVVGSSREDGAKGAPAPSDPALRLRLRRLLGVCLKYTERELNKGVSDGNTPLRVLLMLTGSSSHVACPSGMPDPGMTSAAVASRARVSRSCLELLVFELGLFSTVRNVFIGGDAERKAVSSAGTTTHFKPTPGRQGAVLGGWELVLTALDAVGSLSPIAGGTVTAAAAAAAPIRASLVSEVLSVPLLPSRLGVDGVNSLLKERTGAFVDCLRDFRVEMTGRSLGAAAAGSAATAGAVGTRGSGATAKAAGVADKNRKNVATGSGGGWGAFRLPPPPVSCCSTETFLLGNLVAMGTKLSVEGGGSRRGGRGGDAGRREQREFMRAVTSLLELGAIPESLLTDRQAITWQSQDGASGGGSSGTSMTALAVPQAVQDQVRLLVSDRWVRSASKLALEGVNEKLLLKCTEAERLDNREILESDAADLAMASVRSHRAEANRGFVSKWAEKLLNTSKKWFSSADSQTSSSAVPAAAAPSPSLPPDGAGSGLIDASAASRAAAVGQKHSKAGPGGGGSEGEGGGGAGSGADGGGRVVDPADEAHSYDAGNVLALSEFLGVLLRRWGTGTNASNQVMQGVLSTLCFSFPCVARLWAFALNECPSFERLCDSAPVRSAEGGGLHSTVAVMCCLFSHLLVVLDDAELYEKGQPLPLHHIRTLVKGLKRPLFVFCWEHERNEGAVASTGHFGTFFATAAERLLRGLYVRSSRKTLCRSGAWVVPQAESSRVLAEIKTMSTRARRLLHAMPYCMSLTQRMRIFEHLVKADKQRHQPENTPGVPIRIRRGHVLEDGLAALGSGGRAERQTKRRLIVMYTGAAGHEESGIDMGGLFKDFWTDLSALSFDINYGLFRVTKEGLMYPNPSSGVVHGLEHLRLFEFLGRILGKALYEGITVQPEFATFFLGFIRGDYNFLHLFHDLHGLDPELYRNLMFLKTYDGGDVEDLCLTFTVADEEFGATKEAISVDLIPGGSRRAVTSANRLEYVNRVAKHHLVDGVKPQAEAFVRGLWEVIDPQWLQMFSEPELQVLISGSNKTLDVEDLKRHTRQAFWYSGGFVGIDRTVKRFWSVVNSMSPKERAALLRFVTSCERPPPLGFESMQPPFCLHRVGIRSDGERLPTASTCFNTLKLPTYSSEKVLRAKLLVSIFSGTGFELS
ncbi:unnamed protein product [Pylaiella littoralis]